MYLLKTADGSLVAREWTWFTASFFGFVERLWFRFPAMEPAPGTQATKVVNP